MRGRSGQPAASAAVSSCRKNARIARGIGTAHRRIAQTFRRFGMRSKLPVDRTARRVYNKAMFVFGYGFAGRFCTAGVCRRGRVPRFRRSRNDSVRHRRQQPDPGRKGVRHDDAGTTPRAVPRPLRAVTRGHAPRQSITYRERGVPAAPARCATGRRPISQGSPRCTDWHRKGLVLPCPEKGFPRTALARVQMPPASAPFRRFLPSPEDKCPPGVLLAHPASGGAHDTRRLLNIQRCS